MVRIIGYEEREDHTSFFVLELQGGIEMVLIQTTKRYYATAKKAYISSIFDEQTCQALMGTEMQGNIIKEECEPYDYVIKETGEEITLYHRWVYMAEEVQAPVKPQELAKPNSAIIETVLADPETLSSNGVLEHV